MPRSHHLGVLRTLVLMVIAGPLAIVTLARRPQTAALSPTAVGERVWTPPRTVDGQVDLQGVWINNSATPLERPKALEGKPLLTDDEVAELKRRATRLIDNGNGARAEEKAIEQATKAPR